MSNQTDWWSIGDRERTDLQETGMVLIEGNTPMVAIMAMADDLGIKHEEISIASGFEGYLVITVVRPKQ